ncbi:MAG: hypothetical protein AAB527_00795 [Patescibacteria group bacterium]
MGFVILKSIHKRFYKSEAMFAFRELSEAKMQGSASIRITQKALRPILRRERRPALPAGAKNGRSEKAISPSHKSVCRAK